MSLGFAPHTSAHGVGGRETWKPAMLRGARLRFDQDWPGVQYEIGPKLLERDENLLVREICYCSV